MTRRITPLFLAAPLLLAACGSGTSRPAASARPAALITSADLAKVTLRVGDQVKLTQAGLDAAGQSTTPYRIEWSSFPSGPPLLEALNANAIDVGGVGDAPPVFSAAGGADIRIVLASATPEVNQGILVRRGSAITSVAGLRGKKIAVARDRPVDAGADAGPTPAALHPVVRVHPDTGERALFVNPVFTSHLIGVSARESRQLLDLFFHQIGRPEFSIRFRWAPNSVAFWDNRATAHVGPVDLAFADFDRVVRRVTIVGDLPVGPDGFESRPLEGALFT